MKLKLTPYSLLIIALLALSACSKKSDVPVPADAALVLHIDGGSLSSKLDWNEFKQGELYKMAMEESHDDFAKKILSNPDSSGIDIKSDAYFFIVMRGRGAYSAFTFKIKDEKAFASFMANVAEEKKIDKEGDLSVIKDDHAVATWNSKRFVFIGDSPEFANAKSFGESDSYSKRRFSQDSLMKFAKAVYDMKGSSSIGNNDKFASLVKESADMHFWFNSGKFYSNTMHGMLSLVKASTLFDGNFATAKINFENGRISLDGKNYYNKELADLYKQYSGKNLDEEMLKKIPSGNVTGVFALNYPPEGLKAFLKLLGLDGMVNDFLADLNYSVDEFVKATKGDLLFAVSDFGMKEKEIKYNIGGQEYSNKTTTPDVKVLFATSVNDKAAFQKLMTSLKEKINSSEGEFMKSMAAQIPYQLKDNWFVAGSDSGYINAFGTTSTNHPFISKITGHPMGGYVDIQKIISGYKAAIKDSLGRVVADESAKFWQDIVFYGGERDGDASTSHLEINLVDKSTNSLKQLNNYFGMIAKIFKENEKQRRAEWETMDAPKVEMQEAPVDSTK